MGIMKTAINNIAHAFARIIEGKDRPHKITRVQFNQGWVAMPREERYMWFGLFVAAVLLLFVVLGTLF